MDNINNNKTEIVEKELWDHYSELPNPAWYEYKNNQNNMNMQTIKFLKNNKIQLNGLTYKPYSVCDLPANFGCIEFKSREGISEWFNYKGLTYILDN